MYKKKMKINCKIMIISIVAMMFISYFLWLWSGIFFLMLIMTGLFGALILIMIFIYNKCIYEQLEQKKKMP